MSVVCCVATGEAVLGRDVFCLYNRMKAESYFYRGLVSGAVSLLVDLLCICSFGQGKPAYMAHPPVQSAEFHYSVSACVEVIRMGWKLLAFPNFLSPPPCIVSTLSPRRALSLPFSLPLAPSRSLSLSRSVYKPVAKS